MQTSTFAVDGPACGVCLAELLERLRKVCPVTSVAAELSPDGTTRVVLRSPAQVSADRVHAVIEEAGFMVVPGDDGPGHRHRARTLAARTLPRARMANHRRGGTVT